MQSISSLSPEETHTFLHDSFPPALALMNEVVHFGGKHSTDKRYGGTFNLDSCIALFCYAPATRQAAVFHIPASSTDWENLTHQLHHLITRMGGKKVHITLATGANPSYLPDAEEAIARLHLPQTVTIRQLPNPVAHKDASYIASLAAYTMDSTTGHIFMMDNPVTDHLAMQNHVPDVTGPFPALRMSFASGSRFLNLPQRTRMVNIFSDGRFHASTMEAHLQTMTHAARQMYRQLQTISDTPDKNAASTLWRQKASTILHHHMPDFTTLDEKTQATALNQLEWHFQESHQHHKHIKHAPSLRTF